MSNQDAMEVAKRLKYAREALKITQDNMATSINVGRSTYSNWEYGMRLPDPLKIAKLTDMYGITLNWIYRGVLNDTPRDLADKIQEIQRNDK